MSEDEETTNRKSYRVFLSYSWSDKGLAESIARNLDARDIKVWLDTRELDSGDSWVSKVKDGISASDYLIVLLSKDSVKSSWLKYELSQSLIDLANRDITLLPVRVDDCEVPSALTNYQFIDLLGDFETGLKKLTDIIEILPEVNFGKLDPIKFEALVAELLWKTGFKNIRTPSLGRDTDSADLIADYKTSDPFGFEESNPYFIQCKYYRHSRADLKSLHYFVDSLKSSPKDYKVLLVTNSQLTSAASEWLTFINKHEKISIRVIGGTELKRLLLRYVDLVSKYFSSYRGDKS